MSTTELKNKLKEKIDELNEDYLLEELLSIIELETKNQKVVEIPEHHKERLELSLKQSEEGNTFPHNQVIQELRNGLAN